VKVHNGPEIIGAKGAVKFWVKDRTTTIEIKDIGSTKVEVPGGAKKKVS
jgi:hypothetical protein